MKPYKLSRVLGWISFNGLFLAFGYYGLLHSIDGARQVFLFGCWFCAITAIIASLSTEAHKAAYERGHSVPRFIGGGFDIAVTLTLVWFGYYATGVFYALGGMAEHYVFTEDPSKETE